jgi:hypothetical protein
MFPIEVLECVWVEYRCPLVGLELQFLRVHFGLVEIFQGGDLEQVEQGEIESTQLVCNKVLTTLQLLFFEYHRA